MTLLFFWIGTINDCLWENFSTKVSKNFLWKGERSTFSLPERKSCKKKQASQTLDRTRHQLSRLIFFWFRKCRCPVAPIATIPKIKRFGSVGSANRRFRFDGAVRIRSHHAKPRFVENLHSMAAKRMIVYTNDSERLAFYDRSAVEQYTKPEQATVRRQPSAAIRR